MNETTAQEASGATIAPRDDLKVDVFFTRREIERACGSSRIDTRSLVERSEPCARQEAVDAAGPVDAQNAPTGPWKTADGFPQASTAILVFVTRREESTRQRARPAHDKDRVPLRSPAALSLLPRHRQK